MPYWRHFYHLIWATRDRMPLIGKTEEAIIRRSFTLTLSDLDVMPHAVGFMPDHVHLVVSIPPKHAVAEVVRRLKGASSHAINERVNVAENGRFAWQGEYGSLTLGEKSLGSAIAYVENQRQHHSGHELLSAFERVAEPT